MLVLSISEDFDKLFQDGGLAAITPLGEFCRVVIVAVDASFMLVVAVRGAKHGRTHGTGKVLNVVFPVERGNVGTTERLAALKAEQVKAAEVVGLAQRVLAGWLFGNGEEFRGNDFAAVLQESVSGVGWMRQVLREGGKEREREKFGGPKPWLTS